ncbi:hypothetical protein [Methylobacterium goesingense]|uniref:Uncharacterized protein n=1 Tax=Methylobacterium goesingense TaxID=243690 RepID=A0ABV2LB87_9HYPH
MTALGEECGLDRVVGHLGPFGDEVVGKGIEEVLEDHVKICSDGTSHPAPQA